MFLDLFITGASICVRRLCCSHRPCPAKSWGCVKRIADRLRGGSRWVIMSWLHSRGSCFSCSLPFSILKARQFGGFRLFEVVCSCVGVLLGVICFLWLYWKAILIPRWLCYMFSRYLEGGKKHLQGTAKKTPILKMCKPLDELGSLRLVNGPTKIIQCTYYHGFIR